MSIIIQSERGDFKMLGPSIQGLSLHIFGKLLKRVVLAKISAMRWPKIGLNFLALEKIHCSTVLESLQNKMPSIGSKRCYCIKRFNRTPRMAAGSSNLGIEMSFFRAKRVFPCNSCKSGLACVNKKIHFQFL